jgi:hypothetical protein
MSGQYNHGLQTVDVFQYKGSTYVFYDQNGNQRVDVDVGEGLIKLVGVGSHGEHVCQQFRVDRGRDATIVGWDPFILPPTPGVDLSGSAPSHQPVSYTAPALPPRLQSFPQFAQFPQGDPGLSKERPSYPTPALAPPSKGRLIRCTVPGSTPNCLAMTLASTLRLLRCRGTAAALALHILRRSSAALRRLTHGGGGQVLLASAAARLRRWPSPRRVIAPRSSKQSPLWPGKWIAD